MFYNFGILEEHYTIRNSNNKNTNLRFCYLNYLIRAYCKNYTTVYEWRYELNVPLTYLLTKPYGTMFVEI